MLYFKKFTNLLKKFYINVLKWCYTKYTLIEHHNSYLYSGGVQLVEERMIPMQFDHTGSCIISGYAPTATKAESEVKGGAQVSEASASPKAKRSSIIKKIAIPALLPKKIVRDMVFVIK